MNLLVRKAKKQDKEAFSQLMRENGRDMYRVAKAILKNDDDVADAMQETAMACWEKISTLRQEEFFKTWMIRILINKCNAIYRKRSQYVSDEKIVEMSAVEDAYANVEWKELLRHLGEKYRTVIILYYVEGFKVREIARILEISESAVKSRMATARQIMEKIYRNERRCRVI